MHSSVAKGLDAEAPPLVRFKGISKSYDGQSVSVRDLDLDVRHGEFLTFLGPSGSGKTTTLMMLAGFETQTSGSIELGGRSIDRTPPHKRGIGMVFQNLALFPHMTVAENVAYPLKVRRIPSGETGSKVRAALDMVHMGQFAARRPSQLSGGQQQRVALARALVFDPKLVLMDEPLGALDKQLREHMQYEIRRIHGVTGCTMVYVTHDQSEAMAMSDRIAIFAGGHIQQIGTPAEVYRAPATQFVASFIGENNFLSGRIAAVAGARMSVRLDGGEDVDAETTPEAIVGNTVKLAIRPEMVRLSSGTKASESGDRPPHNQLTATVRDVIFLGDHHRVLLSCGGKDDFVIKAEVSENVARGQPVRVFWNIADAQVFDA